MQLSFYELVYCLNLILAACVTKVIDFIDFASSIKNTKSIPSSITNQINFIFTY